jgi:hypothetical protein
VSPVAARRPADSEERAPQNPRDKQKIRLRCSRIFCWLDVPRIEPYAIGIIPRDGDPNVGHPPRDKLLHKHELGGYIAP